MTWPLHGSEAGVDLVLIQTHCFCCVNEQLSLSQAPRVSLLINAAFGACYRGFVAFLEHSNFLKIAKLRRSTPISLVNINNYVTFYSEAGLPRAGR